jgi:hypothetical protein
MKRRLSKRERKALKKNKRQPKISEKQYEEEGGSPADIEKQQHESMKRNEEETNLPQNEKSPDKQGNGGGDDDDEEEKIRQKCLQTYTPVDIPKKTSSDFLTVNNNKSSSNTNNDTIADEGGCRTLGKWFPNAIFIKSSINYTNTGKLIVLNAGQNNHNTLTEDEVRVENPKSSLVLFYQYTTSADSTATAHWDRTQLQLLMTYLSAIARRRNLGGRIRVAPEGVNATISAVDTKQVTAQEALRHFAFDLQQFDPKVFTNTDFKYLDHLPADRHFKELKILPVQELVFYDIGEEEAPLIQHHHDRKAANLDSQEKEKSDSRIEKNDVKGGGIHLDAKEYHKMLQKENTVVIGKDNFDGYCAMIGSVYYSYVIFYRSYLCDPYFVFQMSEITTKQFWVDSMVSNLQ